MFKGILGSSTDAEMAVLDKALKYVGEMGDARKRDSMKKRLMMMLMRDGYDASLCRSSWVATCDCPGGDISICRSREDRYFAQTRMLLVVSQEITST